MPLRKNFDKLKTLYLRKKLPLGDIMKSKLYLIIVFAVASGVPMPAQAGIWSSLRNSPIVTTLFGKPVETNYTAQTRLPVVEVKPSFWARMFNFYSWMNFKKSAQPEAAPAPEPAQPILSREAAARFTSQLDLLRNKYMQTESILSRDAAQNLTDHLDVIRKKHEAKKIAELEAIEKIKKENEELSSRIEHAQKASSRNISNPATDIETLKKQIQEKNNDQDLLIAKLDREENTKQEAMNILVNQLQMQTAQVESFSKAVNDRLNKLNGRFSNIQSQVVQKLSLLNNPLLPVIETQTGPDGQAIELIQSTVSPQLNKSVTGEIAGSFSELPLTPSSSPELPGIGQSSSAESIMHQMQIDPIYYKEQVERGRKYADAIDANHLNEIPRATQQEYLNSIISIGWHLYDLALQKGQGFMEGTFILEDRNFKLYNFLMEYTKQQNTDIKDDLQDPLLHVSENPFAYSRDASHYVHLKNQFRSYGIDIRFGADQEAQPLLPALKRHILYSKIDQDVDNLIYIKFENFGICKKDVAKHTKEYLGAQLGKNNIFARSIRTIAYYCNYTIPADSDGSNRKERLVPEFIDAINAAITHEASFTNEQKKLYMGYANLEGFKALYFTPITGLPSVRALIQKYENDPKKYDHMRWRTGQEVIHGQNEWVPRLALRNGTLNK